MSPTYIITFSLLLFPLLGLILGYLTRNHHLLRRCIIYPILVIALVAIVAALFGFSTINTNIDFALYSSLYLSISLGLWYIFFKKSRILAALIMMTLYACGYMFSLTLPLTGDIMPKVILQLDNHLIYKETVISAEYSAKQVEVFRVYNNFFEKRIFGKIYYNDAPAFVSDTLNINYRADEQKIYLSMPTDVSKHIYTFHEKFNLDWKDTIQIIR